jgi:hypothetical protein
MIAVIPALILLALIVIPLVVVTRYFHHRETMKILEVGGDTRQALQLRERWRVRSGILLGALMAVIGVASLAGVVIYTQLLAITLAGMPKPRTGILDVPSMTAVVAAAVFLILIGVTTLVAHTIWSLKLREQENADELTPTGERWRNRAGLLYGAKLLVVGVMLVVIGGASNQWLWTVMPKREVLTLGLATPPLLIFLGLLLAAVGAVYLVAYAIWSRRPLFGDKPAHTDLRSNSGQEPPA